MRTSILLWDTSQADLVARALSARANLRARRAQNCQAWQNQQQRLTFNEEHDHKWYYEGQAAVFLHQNGKSDYVAQADWVAAQVSVYDYIYSCI